MPYTGHGETMDDWPSIATSTDGQWRIIISDDTPPALQWILQRRKPSKRHASGYEWRSTKYCQSKIGLKLFATFDPALEAVVNALPDWCPQKRGGEPHSSPEATMVAGDP